MTATPPAETWLREIAALPSLPLEDDAVFCAGEIIGGEYVIQERIGEGGMGVVYAAWDRTLGRDVAVKVARTRLIEGHEAARVEIEARHTARLHHPNVITIHRVGIHAGRLFLVFERLVGTTLAARTRHGSVDPMDALDLMIEVANALAHAHQTGVVHRDLKPENIFLCDDGALKVLDFGLATLVDSEDGLHGGTPGYSAPEQLERGAHDARVDVYSAGRVIASLLDDRGVRRECVRDLRVVATRCTKTDPDERFFDGRDLLDALETVRARHRTWRRVTRWFVRVLSICGVAACVATAAWGIWWNVIRVPPDPAQLDRLDGWYRATSGIYGYVHLIRAGQRSYSWAGYRSPAFTIPSPDVYQHEGLMRIRDDGEWLLEGNLTDTEGFCCGHVGELVVRVVSDDELAVEETRWGRPGDSMVALGAHRFARIKGAFDVGPFDESR